MATFGTLVFRLKDVKVEGMDVPTTQDLFRAPISSQSMRNEIQNLIDQLDKGDDDGGAIDGDVDGVTTVKVANPVDFLRVFIGKDIDAKAHWEIAIEDDQAEG